MRLIDADALIERMKNDNPQTSKIKWLQILAHSAPTIDAVEVVRCKECEHYNSEANVSYIAYCPMDNDNLKPTDYCSCGKRREE